jgi:uncharacterized protein (DUF1697 family)
VAFLRAINVGGRTVTMDRLRTVFTGLGLERVETFIASGNVVFESRAGAKSLTPAIERALRAALGYDVHTFLRTDAEVAAIAAREVFSAAAVSTAGAHVVGFMAAPLPAAGAKALMALQTDTDTFAVRGSEVHWLCRTRQSESAFSNMVFEKVTGVRATFRGLNTVRRLAAKYPPR